MNAHDPTRDVLPAPDAAPPFLSEDLWAVLLGGVILLAGFAAVYVSRPADAPQIVARIQDLESDPTADSKDKLQELRQQLAPNPLARFVTKLQRWNASPAEAFRKTSGDETRSLIGPVLAVGLVSMLLFGMGAVNLGERPVPFACAFAALFLLTLLAYLLASHEVIKHYNLEYPLWALLVGLIISNTVGTPKFLQPAVKTEFYIKTGIVLLGAKLLLGRLLALGLPGVFVSWLVTPVVLISTFWFGQRILKIASPSLNMTISADMSVCGVSAAIATAAACKAKKEELSTAVGLSLMFTAVMMFVMPQFIKWLGLSPTLGGAWLGGTIDATGAVAAAGAFLGPEAESVAITVKMIQNILIGVIAFGVATYWVTHVEAGDEATRPDAWEIWRRFPKFILGFLAASIVFSLIVECTAGGQEMVTSMIKGTSDVFRGWFFCLAFVSIGLDTNFRELAKHMSGGKPIILYVLGQTLNLLLTLGMAWLMFEVVFRVAR